MADWFSPSYSCILKQPAVTPPPLAVTDAACRSGLVGASRVQLNSSTNTDPLHGLKEINYGATLGRT